MKIALCSSSVPFVRGGYSNIVNWLAARLHEAGHRVEQVYLPHAYEDIPELVFPQMAAYRWLDLSSADRVICFRPPAHFVPHPHKVLWFIHHIRLYYDLWDTPYRSFPADSKSIRVRDALHAADTAALIEARRVFTNSQVVSDRIKKFNGLDSEVLYPPIMNPEQYRCEAANDEIVMVCRIEHHKRQHLLIEALKHTKTAVKLRICGVSSGSDYFDDLRGLIAKANLQGRVFLENRWISEQEKTDLFAKCLASAYLPLDEDSYGYPSLESAHSAKAVLTASDSGGTLEFVQTGVNGLVAEPEAMALAEAMDRLFLDREKTRKMGEAALERIGELNISWHHVIERLLS